VGRAGGVRVHAAPNGRDDARVGLSVPGMASAVERNRARRRLREAARELRAHRGYDLIVSCDTTAVTAPLPLLREQVEAAALRGISRVGHRPPPPGPTAASPSGEGGLP